MAVSESESSSESVCLIFFGGGGGGHEAGLQPRGESLEFEDGGGVSGHRTSQIHRADFATIGNVVVDSRESPTPTK